MSQTPQANRIPLYGYLSATGGVFLTTDVDPVDMLTGGTPAAPEEFYLQAPAGWVYVVERMLPFVECGRVGFSADTYGDLTALTNGILVQYRRSNGDIITDLTGGRGIKHNSGWRSVCHDSEPDQYGTGNRAVGIRWTFSKAGQPLYLPSDRRLCVLGQDSLVGLVEHRFMVQGWKYAV